MHSTFWPSYLRCEDLGWSKFSVASTGNDLFKLYLGNYIGLCACVYFAYYRDSSFVVWLSSELNCCEGFVAVAVVYVIHLMHVIPGT